jgi:hypothetical protein
MQSHIPSLFDRHEGRLCLKTLFRAMRRQSPRRAPAQGIVAQPAPMIDCGAPKERRA